jgi:hypothetical protein
MVEQDVIDSRLLATELKIEHWALMQTLKKYKNNSTFGVIDFKISEDNDTIEKFALLNESQTRVIKNYFFFQDHFYKLLD